MNIFKFEDYEAFWNSVYFRSKQILTIKINSNIHRYEMWLDNSITETDSLWGSKIDDHEKNYLKQKKKKLHREIVLAESAKTRVVQILSIIRFFRFNFHSYLNDMIDKLN